MKFFSDENRVILSGRLTENPVLRYTQKKTPVCRFTLAVNTYNKIERQTLFIPVVVWSEVALECSTMLRKGSMVKVEGKLASREWEDFEGRNHKVIEVVASKVEVVVKEKKEQQEDVQS